MKKSILFTTATALVSLSLCAADSSPKDEVAGAVKMLSEKDNYSWRTTTVVPESAPFKPGPVDGKAERDGFTLLNLTFGDNDIKAVLKGDKGAATTPDGGWQSISELESSEGPTRFLGAMLRNLKAPAAQASQIVSGVKEFKKDGDAFSGELTEEGAKALLTFRMRSGDGPKVSNPKGSVKFWLKEGALIKYQYNVKGTISFNDNEFEQDRTTTVEIKDVGVTKLTVPEEAKKKLN